MHCDVERFVQSCPTCQKQQTKKVEFNTPPFVTSFSQPHERLNADTLLLHECDNGYKAAVVIVDTCTRWTEIYPITDLTEEQATMCFLRHFGRFGPPKEIVTDRGSQFLNKTVKALFNAQDIKYVPTPIAHSHEHNARVERTNKEVLRHIRNYCQDMMAQRDWTRAVPAVQYILNTTRNKLTGYTPFELLFGPTHNLKHLLLEPKVLPEDNAKWWEEQQVIHSQILSKATALQQEVDDEHLKLRLKRGALTSYEIDSYVLVSYPTALGDKGRAPSKLMSVLKGPLKVMEREGDAYTLLDLVSRRTEIVHVSRIFPFKYDSTRTDPERIAYRDKEEFVVEHIVDAEIDLNVSKVHWQFQVRWKGYDESNDLWLPWSELKM